MEINSGGVRFSSTNNDRNDSQIVTVSTYFFTRNTFYVIYTMLICTRTISACVNIKKRNRWYNRCLTIDTVLMKGTIRGKILPRSSQKPPGMLPKFGRKRFKHEFLFLKKKIIIIISPVRKGELECSATFLEVKSLEKYMSHFLFEIVFLYT